MKSQGFDLTIIDNEVSICTSCVRPDTSGDNWITITEQIAQDQGLVFARRVNNIIQDIVNSSDGIVEYELFTETSGSPPKITIKRGDIVICPTCEPEPEPEPIIIPEPEPEGIIIIDDGTGGGGGNELLK